VVGAEPNFWAYLSFMIAVVGDLQGFFRENGGTYLLDEFAKAYLDRHEGQMGGYFLGKWIYDQMEFFMNGRMDTNGQVNPGFSHPNVTFIQGTITGRQGTNVAVRGTDQTPMTLVTKSAETEVILTPGLGSPSELPITYTQSGAKGMSNELKVTVND